MRRTGINPRTTGRINNRNMKVGAVGALDPYIPPSVSTTVRSELNNIIGKILYRISVTIKRDRLIQRKPFFDRIGSRKPVNHTKRIVCLIKNHRINGIHRDG